ncbi:MAG: Holliday junction branch migration protein RuvA [Rikenellaceae bacterium]
MYDYIVGKVSEISPTVVVIENNGIGYNMNISLQTFTALASMDEAKIYVHQYLVRDDLPVLYGFYTKVERDLFKLLIGVSGVGGNTARMILSTFSIADLVSIISSGKSVMLKTVKGLGAKTSEKVIVELRDKVSGLDSESVNSFSDAVSVVDNELYEEAVSALTMLGFAKASSAKVVKSLISENPSYKVEDIIRLSLKKM